MATNNLIAIEVIYAAESSQKLIKLTIPVGSSVEYAVQQSGILDFYPEINLNENKIGIFSKLVNLDKILEAGDRIEIYRSLKIDPKQARKIRAKKQKSR